MDQGMDLQLSRNTGRKTVYFANQLQIRGETMGSASARRHYIMQQAHLTKGTLSAQEANAHLARLGKAGFRRDMDTLLRPDLPFFMHPVTHISKRHPSKSQPLHEHGHIVHAQPQRLGSGLVIALAA